MGAAARRTLRSDGRYPERVCGMGCGCAYSRHARGKEGGGGRSESESQWYAVRYLQSAEAVEAVEGKECGSEK